MKPALHRSITFWSGILVMSFICWAWRDSAQHSRWLGKAPWSLDSFGSGIALKHDTSYKSGWKIPEWQVGLVELKDMPEYYGEFSTMRLGQPFLTHPLDPQEQKEWLNALRTHKRDILFDELVPTEKSLRPDREPLEIMYQLDVWTRGGPDDWKLFCPYWILLLAFALPWTALLLWRAKRRNRTPTAA